MENEGRLVSLTKPLIIIHPNISYIPAVQSQRMVDWNPRVHARHAWADAHSLWGKLSLVIFYGWIWIKIVLALWGLFHPTRGLECLSDTMYETDLSFLIGMFLSLPDQTSQFEPSRAESSYCRLSSLILLFPLFLLFIPASSRALNVLFIAVLGYADAGGFQMKNLTYMLVVALAYSAMWIPLVAVSRGMEEPCRAVGGYWQIALSPMIFGIALLLLLVDSTMAPAGGNPDERTALV